ncbi:hypothetical protein [Streptantibioticus cattleyicolor]|uniref:Chaplin domain-containing protein n=1 Tax=Streptantibioticus cattleyicolor (strain ATCC 35852 / DSM 46488 / JCM 4925 / NBRC 14057 / NRRL 8057) TaxID=1003195 RepID=F8JKI3_STREN|nr:hypothetical protein [Streptantibioticus cattleyicolor]AEW99747.1 hypothetical protein SCATT_p15540 [Streptantibioticus cattleyicolor NRRL 8057 = DSM 46488]CCB71212.1 exported protein of unknown function [Streptantibioticus cattleyicolor NRRL 8057 = DSM 46488]
MVRRSAAVVMVAVTTVAGGAGGAAATSVIGVGNSAHSNSCRNTTGHGPRAATTSGAGSVTGLAAALPGTSPVNQCGDLGIPNIVLSNPGHGTDIIPILAPTITIPQ